MKVLNFLGVGLLAIGTVTITPVRESPAIAQEFQGINGLILNLDGLNFYWEGPPIYPTTTRDIPGHYWTQTSPTTLTAQHWNIGPKTELTPEGIGNWWSSDAPARSLLYTAEVIIDEWTSQIAAEFAAEGFVHYHELVSVDDPTLSHPTKVGWFRHTAVRNFRLDGGPRPELAHSVPAGEIDFQFIPNNATPYEPANVVSLPVPEPSSLLGLLVFSVGSSISVFLGKRRADKF